MPDIQIIANIIYFDGYAVAQIDPNVPEMVRQRFEKAITDTWSDGYDAGYEDGTRDAE